MTSRKKRKRDLVKVCRPSPEELKLFEPWFRPRQESFEIRRTQTVPELRKWRVYFDRWGCVTCGTNKRMHAGLGFCQTCYMRVSQRIKEILEDMDRHA